MKIKKCLETLLIASPIILTNCTAPVVAIQPIKTNEVSTTSKPSQSEKPYLKIDIKKFSEYNPSHSSKTAEIKDNNLLQSILNGFDAYFITDNVDVANKEKLLVLVTNAATDMSYRLNDLSRLSIREAVELAAKITAQRLHYIGHFDIKPLRASRVKLENILARPNLGIEEKIILEDAIEELKGAEKHAKDMADEILRYSGELIKVNGTDKLPAEELLQRGMFVVCRNYIAVNKAVFDTLKLMNPNLKNTYMSIYGNWNHGWNQVTTIHSDEQNNITLEVTFVDPTHYDTVGNIEALDEHHFGPDFHSLKTALELTYSSQRFYKKHEDQKVVKSE